MTRFLRSDDFQRRVDRHNINLESKKEIEKWFLRPSGRLLLYRDERRLPIMLKLKVD